MSELLADMIDERTGEVDQKRQTLKAAFVAGYVAAKPDTRADDCATRNAAESKFRNWARSAPWDDG